MRRLKAGESILDRCESCYGIWLDKGERIKLMRDKSVVAGIDIGSPETGKEQDEIVDIQCPRCDKPMFHQTDRAQKHIGFEVCRECQGTFFDAGELSDLSEFTLSERIKALFGH